MRITCFLACITVALECSLRALGAAPQAIYSDAFLPMWWLTAAWFALAGLVVLFRGAA